MGFNIEQLKLPPPPPPPTKSFQENSVPPPPQSPESELSNLQTPITSYTKSPRKSDNIESIDMDLSDEDVETRLQLKNDNLKVIVDSSNDEQQFSLEPPPPLPDLPDDVDANNFLDDLANDLHEFSNLSDELNCGNTSDSNTWNQGPLMPPPMMSFQELIGNPLTSGPPPLLNAGPPMNTMTSPLQNPPPPLNEPPPQLSNPPPPLNDGPLNMHPINPLMPPMAMMPPPQPSNWLTKEEGRLGMEPWFPEQEHNQFIHDGKHNAYNVRL